ncbi:Tetratricopeptide-like helical domain superfamily [Sesbania bispinosa]|nr:Tetratricopeptide-like helical domain superfamily [Sesbania bispinosa]
MKKREALDGSLHLFDKLPVRNAYFRSCSALLATNLGRALHSYVVKQDGDGRITGNDATEFFALSNLPHSQLKQLWALADTKRQGFLGFSKSDADVKRVFRTMLSSGATVPNSVTVATVLPVCARSRNLNAEKSVHAYVIKSGFEVDTIDGNTLVSMYAKCGMVSRDAYAVFYNVIHKDVSWNAMIAGLAENGLTEDAF